MNYGDLFQDLGSITLTERATAPRGLALSEEQAFALAGSVERSATVSAGAGAGKTRLLVERAAALVAAGANPARVAVVTFTRKAAKEIANRLHTRLGDPNRVPNCTTVHALALSLLRKAGLDVRVASEAELLALAALLRQELPDDYVQWSDAELVQELNRVREEMAFVGVLGLGARRFEELLAKAGLTDFTALLAVATQIAGHEFDHVLVDEAQDLSALQRQFLRAIGAGKARYWYIGDADQAIYVFRGAHSSVMTELMSACDEHFVLSVNYRCARSIVQHANNVVQFNPGRPDIKWKPHRTDEGSVAVEHFGHGDDELQALEQWLRSGKDRAVLARTQALVAPLKAQGLNALSVHESKGLEWSEVWVMGCEAAMFPHPLGVREEERRLFYVAMTRAKDALTMSYAGSRAARRGAANTRFPSPFLFETQSLEG